MSHLNNTELNADLSQTYMQSHLGLILTSSPSVPESREETGDPRGNPEETQTH